MSSLFSAHLHRFLFLVAAITLLSAMGLNGSGVANDDFVGRRELPGSAPVGIAVMLGATREIGEPLHGGNGNGGSIWWKWTASQSGVATFSSFGSGGRVRLFVYTGTELDSLSNVGNNAAAREPDTEGSSIEIPVEQGKVYSIAAVATHSGPWASHLVVLGINQAPVLLSDALAVAALGTEFSYRIAATNSPTNFEADGLPRGLSCNRLTGEIAGKPLESGSFEVTISCSNPAGTVNGTLTLKVGPKQVAPPAFTNGSATVLGSVGTALTYDYYASGGAALFEASEVLPPGMTAGMGTSMVNGVSTTHGRIAGRPTVAGVYSVSLRAANASGEAQAVVTFDIREKSSQAPILTSSAIAYGEISSSFYYAFSTEHNTDASVLFEVGALPPGLVKQPASIYGTPTEAGTFIVPVSAVDHRGSSTGTLTIVIKDPKAPASGKPIIISQAGAAGVVGMRFSYKVLTEENATSFTATGLPLGLSISSSGVIQGTPSFAGTYQTTVTASNSYGSVSAKISIAINGRKPPLLSSNSYSVAYVGKSFDYKLTQQVESYPWDRPDHIVEATNLPPGLKLSYSSAERNYRINGIPTIPGVYAIPLAAKNEGGQAGYTLTIRVLPNTTAAPRITSSSYLKRPVRQNLTYQVLSSPSASSLTVGELPPGLSYSSSDKSIKGVPTATGIFPVNITATNSEGSTSAIVTFEIGEANLSLNGPAGAGGTVGSYLSSNTNVEGGSALTATWSAENLPPGLSILSSGSISGYPTTPGTYLTRITAMENGVSASIERTFVISESAVPLPTLTGYAFAIGTLGSSFSYSLGASNNPSSVAITGSVPGLAISSDGKVLSGTPTLAGTYELDLTASNSHGTCNGKLTLQILPKSPSGYGASSTEAIVGQSVTKYLYLSNYPTTNLQGALPPGLTVDTANSLISGAPTVPGNYLLSLLGTNASGSIEVPFNFLIRPESTPPLITAPLVDLWRTGQANSVWISTKNEATSVTVSGLPAGLSYDSTTREISGSTNVAGVYPIAITASNNHGSATAVTTIVVRGSSSSSMYSSSMASGVAGTPLEHRITLPSFQDSSWVENLPEGLYFNVEKNSIVGTPSTPGIYIIPVHFKIGGLLVDAMLTLVVDSSPSLPGLCDKTYVKGFVGLPMAEILHFSHFPESVVLSDLPPGLTYDPEKRTLSGIPSAIGRSRVTVTAENAAGATSSRVVIDILPLPLPSFDSSSSFYSWLTIDPAVDQSQFTLSTANDGSTYRAENLPPGMSLDPVTSVLKGTPTVSGIYPATITATNGAGSVTVFPTFRVLAKSPPVITSDKVYEIEEGNPFTYAAVSSGATFTSANLPPGIVMLPSGACTGIAIQAGTYTTSITATNSEGSSTAEIEFRVIPRKVPTPNMAATASGVVGYLFNWTLSSSGSRQTYQIGALPPGLFQVSNSGTITGTPISAGVYNIPVSVTNSSGGSHSTATIYIDSNTNEFPTINVPLGREIEVGTWFECFVGTVGAASVSVSNLPSGLSFDPGSSTIYGFPETAQSTMVQITAQSATSQVSTASIALFPAAQTPAYLLMAENVYGSVGRAFSYQISARKVTAPASGLAQILGSYIEPLHAARGLPPGLFLDSSTGKILGVPTREGEYPVKILSRYMGTTISEDIILRISLGASSSGTIKIESAPLAHVMVLGRHSELQIEASGPVTSFSTSGLPAGITAGTLEASAGVRLSGTPSAVGSYPISIDIRNGSSEISSVVTILVRDPGPEDAPIFSPTLPLSRTGREGVPFSETILFSSAASISSYYAVSVTGLPPGLAYNSATQTIEGTPTAAGNYVSEIVASLDGSTKSRLTFHIVAALPQKALNGWGGAYGGVPRTGFSTGSFGFLGLPFEYDLDSDDADFQWSDTVPNSEPTRLSDPAGLYLFATPNSTGSYGIRVETDTLTLASSGLILPKPDFAGDAPVYPEIVSFEAVKPTVVAGETAEFTVLVKSSTRPNRLDFALTTPGNPRETRSTSEPFSEQDGLWSYQIAVTTPAPGNYAIGDLIVHNEALLRSSSSTVQSQVIARDVPRIVFASISPAAVGSGQSMVLTLRAASFSPLNNVNWAIDDVPGNSAPPESTEIEAGLHEYRFSIANPAGTSPGTHFVQQLKVRNEANIVSGTWTDLAFSVRPPSSSLPFASAFSSSFNVSELPSELEQGSPAIYSANGAIRNTRGVRDYIRTKAADFVDVNFRMTVTATIPDQGGDAACVFAGIGEGTPSVTGNGFPARSAYLLLEPDGSYTPRRSPGSEGNGFVGIDDGTPPPSFTKLGITRSGTHRICITKLGDTLTFAVDCDSTAGPFEASYQKDITIADELPFLEDGNAHLFFGTQAGSSFDDLKIEIIPEQAEISLGNLVHTYDGNPKSVSVATFPAGLPFSVTYNDSSTVPTQPGSYSVKAVMNTERYEGVATATLTIEKIPQTITFASVGDRIFQDEPIQLAAESDSGLTPIRYRVISGAATLQDDLLTLTGVGAVVVEAFHDGDEFHQPAAVRQTFQIGKVAQSISFTLASRINFRRTPIALSPASTASLPVTVTRLSGPAVVVGNRLTMTGLGSVALRATQPGTATVSSASPINLGFQIVDTEAPILRAAKSRLRTTSKKTRLNGTTTDNHIPASVRYRMKVPGKSFGPWRSVAMPGIGSSKSWSFSVATPADGKYVVETRAMDQSGNSSSLSRVTITKKK